MNIKLIPHSHYGWNDFLHDTYAFFRIGAGAIMLVGAAGASATGVGTVVGVGLASMGADQIITGFKSVYTRQEQTSLGAQALQLLGVPEEYAELAYDALPLGAGMLKIAIPSLKGIQVFTQSGSQQIVSELHLLGASIRQKLTVQWGALSGTKGNIKVYGPHDIGPLGDPNNFRSAASTFRSGTYMEKTAETEIYFYRDYGGKSKVNGRFWTIEPSKGPLQSMLDSAVLPEWGNTFNRQAIIKIPKGTKYFEGVAAAQKGTVGTRPKVHGGGTQIFLPEINKDWIIRQ